MSQNDDNEHSNGTNDNHQDNNDVSDLNLIIFITN